MEIALPVEIIVSGTPVSLQGSAKGRERWKGRVEAAARKEREPEDFLITHPLSVTIYVFLDAPLQGDVDNLLKPILDALKGVIFVDDAQVAEIRIRKIEPEMIVGFEDPSPKLINAIEAERPLVYIRIEELD